MARSHRILFVELFVGLFVGLFVELFVGLFVVGGAGCGGRALKGSDAGRGPDGATTKDGGDAPATRLDGGGSDGVIDLAATTDALDASHATDAADARDGAAERDEAGVVFARAVSAFCEDKAQHWCAFLTRCRFSTADDADCRADEQASCAADVDVWQASAASMGRLGFDATKESDCFAALDEADCAAGTNAQNFPSCDRVYAGRLADGQPCVYAAECQGGFCEVPFHGCAGKCASLGKVGASCSPTGCDLAVASCEAATFTCQPRKSIGAPCVPEQDDPCGPGGYCLSPSGWACGERDDDHDGCHCALPGGAGAACKDSANCGDEVGCVGGACRGPGKKGEACNFDRGGGCAGELVCQPDADTIEDSNPMGFCIDRLPDGAPCNADTCQRGSECSGENPACRRIPAPAIGEACEPLEDRCPLGSYCNDDTMLCTRTPRLGERCEASGDRCWGTSIECLRQDNGAFCAPIPTLGQACSSSCLGDSYCAAGTTCMAKLGKGAPCVAGRQCLSGTCGSPDPATCGDNCRGLFCTEPCSYASLADGGV